MADPANFSIRPAFKDKFRPAAAKAMMNAVLADRLSDKSYNPELTAQWTREIAGESAVRARWHPHTPPSASAHDPEPPRDSGWRSRAPHPQPPGAARARSALRLAACLAFPPPPQHLAPSRPSRRAPHGLA